MGGESTRAVSVGEIKTLRKSDFVPTTRGGEDGDVIYIVDLENGGSAVMGADKRMEPIYAILDETKISPEKLTLTATRSDDGEEDIEEYVMGLMNAKIETDVTLMAAGDLIIPEMPIIPRPQIVELSYIIGAKYPMLKTKWHQRSPYNDNYPRGDVNQYYEDGVMVAGCGPIAVSQALYYLRTPDQLWSYTFDWDLLSECEYQGAFSDAAKAAVAEFVNAVAGCICRERYHQVTPSPMVRINELVYDLVNFGLSNISAEEYDFNGIKELLDDDLPVITRGTELNDTYPALDFGHMWVIDGYKAHRVTKYMREYYGSGRLDFTDTLISSTDYNYVHCNYGWEGYMDGYYTSGVFDVSQQLEDDMIEEEIGDVAASTNWHFEAGLKYISYER